MGHNDKDNYVNSLKSGISIQSNIIKSNVDVFIHTWNQDNNSIKELTDLYQPKKSIFEKQITFGGPTVKHHSTKSRWYSQMKSIQLKEQYEQENDFTYDLVMVSRFDCIYYTNIDFLSLNPNKFYVSNWKMSPSHGFLDYWFIANSHNMNLFSGLYHNLDKYLSNGMELSNHSLCYHHITELGLAHQVSYILNEHKDFKLDRNYG